ncbi:sulfotransferase family 2 domain-containing protein [Deltaproteobacteria bacterium TL4]
MLISHKYKVIFVHIQRTGGNSIQKAFREFDPNLLESISTASSKKLIRHSSILDIKAALDDEIFKNYTKFCVVRNPYDRILSWYFMFKDGYGKDGIIMPDKVVGDQVANEVNKIAKNFDEFVNLPENHASGFFKRFYTNQLDYISDSKLILVDRVLKFENLTHDFDDLAKAIGFEGSLSHINRTTSRDNYRKYYNDFTKSLIFKRFHKDFEYFGYVF